MNRHVRIFVGWPEHLLGKCHTDASARDENFAIVCYEGDTPTDGFLVFEPEKIAGITAAWLMGVDSNEIHHKFINT